jgi:hypothetical protein
MYTVPTIEDTVENDWGMISKKIAPPKEVHCNHTRTEYPTNKMDKDPNIETMKENEPEKEETLSVEPAMESKVKNKDSKMTSTYNDKIMEVNEEKGEITQPKTTMTKDHCTMDIASTNVRGDCRDQPPSIGKLEPKTMTKVRGTKRAKFKTKKEPLLHESTKHSIHASRGVVKRSFMWTDGQTDHHSF